MSRFSQDALVRYSRQMVLAEVGGIGQSRLGETTLAAHSELEALFLAGAGIGTLRVPSAQIAAAIHALNPLVHTEIDSALVLEAIPIAEASRRALTALLRVLQP